MGAVDTFFLNINALLAHTDCDHTLIFRLEFKIVKFEGRILHNTVPFAVLYRGTKA